MKRNILYILLLFVLCSCEKQLEIVPKGKVTLSKTSELELLLNQEYMLDHMPFEDLGILAGESLGAFDQISTVMSQPNTLKYAYMTFNEKVDRAVLSTSDGLYSALYKHINFMNVVITQIDDAEGDEAIKPQLKAEAKVMRAYFHWIAASIYARQYDDATAANAGGIAYVRSTKVTETKQKLPLDEVYRLILEDVSDEVIALLPDVSSAPCIRADKAWGYAVRAMVLLQMKHYSEALPYALKAIELHPQMFDRSFIRTSKEWTQSQQSENNLIWIGNGARVNPTCEMLSLEAAKLFEPGDYVFKYCSTGWSLEFGEQYSGIEGVRMFMDFTTQCNTWGITSEQLRYIAAECLIRAGKYNDGLKLVNDVRRLRVEDAEPFSASTEAEAMALMQKAKFIECLGTPFNYLDIKRWNTESAYKRTVKHSLRTYGTFSLSPKSPLWICPFPSNATRYNETLTQNY